MDELPVGSTILGPSRRVGRGLPVGEVLRKLKLAEVIDARVPDHPARVISTGACVEAMVAAILLSERHTLAWVAEELQECDLELLLGRRIDLDGLHDNRLGRALEMCFKTGLSELGTATLFRAVEVYGFEVDRLHFDTTTLKLFGKYDEYGADFGDPENPDAAPAIVHGYSKDHRPDLKQATFALSVTHGDGLPVLSRVTDGNRADSLENASHIERIAETFPPHLRPTLIADCKLFGGRNLLLARQHGIRIVTLMPRHVGLWDTLFEPVAEQLPSAPRLRERVRRTVEEDEDGTLELLEETGLAEWRGLSSATVYPWKDEDGEVHEIPLRGLVVWSNDQEQDEEARREKRLASEERRLSRSTKALGKKTFHCEDDARNALAELQKKARAKFHRIEGSVVATERPAKRKRRGRPAKDEKRELETVWTVVAAPVIVEHECEKDRIARSSFIIAWSGDDELSDAEVLRLYKAQSGVENQLRWAKAVGHVAPIFLKRAERIAALGFVYTLAMMVRGLIQREVRNGLAETGETVAGNKGQGRTDRPTAEVVFRLFRQLKSMPLRLADGREITWLVNLNTEQHRVLKLLKSDLLERDGVGGVVREPRGLERGRKRTGQPPHLRKSRKTVIERRTLEGNARQPPSN